LILVEIEDKAQLNIRSQLKKKKIYVYIIYSLFINSNNCELITSGDVSLGYADSTVSIGESGLICTPKKRNSW
jgi:hypothetical protein